MTTDQLPTVSYWCVVFNKTLGRLVLVRSSKRTKRSETVHYSCGKPIHTHSGIRKAVCSECYSGAFRSHLSARQPPLMFRKHKTHTQRWLVGSFVRLLDKSPLVGRAKQKRTGTLRRAKKGTPLWSRNRTDTEKVGYHELLCMVLDWIALHWIAFHRIASHRLDRWIFFF